MKFSFLNLLTAGIWLIAIIMGFILLIKYANRPGQAANAPRVWPLNSHFSQVPGHSTLVLLAHPFCPCSRATITELDKIMRKTQGRLDSLILFYRPKKYPAGWEVTSLWHNAIAIPGVKAFTDVDGLEAKIFGAHISGQVLVYNPSGKLVFNGGITGSRGHEGDNQGEDSVIEWVNKGYSALSSTSVFGCHLFKESTTMTPDNFGVF